MKLFKTKEGKIYGGIFIFAAFLYIVLQLMGVGEEDASVKPETRQELYERFSTLIEDVFETSERGLYDTYVSKRIMKDKYLVMWDTYFDYLDKYELQSIPAYEEQDTSFSLRKEEMSKNEDEMETIKIYGSEFQIFILVEGEQVKVPFEVQWVKEGGSWKVLEMKMPRDIKNPGMLKRVFRGD